MPPVFIRRLRPFTDAERGEATNATYASTIGAVALSWSSYVVRTGNAARSRRVLATVNAASGAFPVEASIPRNIRAEAAAHGLIPHELQDATGGYFITKLAPWDEVPERTAEYPDGAGIPFDVEAYDVTGNFIAAGAVQDRAAAVRLFGVLKRDYAAARLDYYAIDRGGKKRLIETLR